MADGGRSQAGAVRAADTDLPGADPPAAGSTVSSVTCESRLGQPRGPATRQAAGAGGDRPRGFMIGLSMQG